MRVVSGKENQGGWGIGVMFSRAISEVHKGGGGEKRASVGA